MVFCRNVETPTHSYISHKAYALSTIDRDKDKASKVDKGKASSTSVLSKYVILMLFCAVLFFACPCLKIVSNFYVLSDAK